MRDPTLGVGDLPGLMLVARALEDTRVLGHELVPLHLVDRAVEGETLGVDAMGEDHRVVALPDRAKYVCPEDSAVRHLDRDLIVDLHPVHLAGKGEVVSDDVGGSWRGHG